jgi:hypothetical protein
MKIPESRIGYSCYQMEDAKKRTTLSRKLCSLSQTTLEENFSLEGPYSILPPRILIVK